MKKNRLFVLGIITMFVAILSLTLVSGTMARYTSKVSGESKVSVAKWAFTLNDGTTDENVTENEQYDTFDLFKTIKDEDGSAENDVAAGLIAPGTSGAFTIKITNNSEVNAEFSIDFTSVLEIDGSADDTYLPLIFTLKRWNGTDYDVVSTVDKLSYLEVEKVAIAMNASVEYLVEWKWAFVGEDSKDTGLGIDAVTKTVEYITTVTVTFDQVQ